MSTSFQVGYSEGVILSACTQGISAVKTKRSGFYQRLFEEDAVFGGCVRPEEINTYP